VLFDRYSLTPYSPNGEGRSFTPGQVSHVTFPVKHPLPFTAISRISVSHSDLHFCIPLRDTDMRYWQFSVSLNQGASDRHLPQSNIPSRSLSRLVKAHTTLPILAAYRYLTVISISVPRCEIQICSLVWALTKGQVTRRGV